MSTGLPASFSIVIIAPDAAGDREVGAIERYASLPGPPREACLVLGMRADDAAPDLAGRLKVKREPSGDVAAARNLGLAAAAGDVVVFPDPVMPPPDDLLESLCEAFADRRVAAVSTDRGWTAFRRVDLEAIGGFDEVLPPGDDIRDALRRLVAAGRRVVGRTPEGAGVSITASPPPRRLMSPGTPARIRRPFLPLTPGVRSCGGDPAPPVPVASPVADEPFAAQRRLLRDVWADLLPTGTRCALVGYPDHWNVGDAAIWWGTRRLLDTLGVTVDYACDPWSYEPAALQAAVPGGPILILGGGNLGDAYRHEQSLRERILVDFPRRRIVQLPQSIWFASPGKAEAMANLLLQAGDVTLLLRDATSLEFARRTFRCASALCPDSAIALDLTGVGDPPDVPIFALWRTDREACEAGVPDADGVVVQDWTTPGPETSRMSTAARGFKAWVGDPPPEIGTCPRRRRLAWRRLPWLWDQLAEDRTLRGCRLLSRGRVVVTDRLHAHLLCTLMRKPHVVCDATNGKVFAYRDTWRVADPLVRFAANRAEAIALAREVLASCGSSGPDRA